MTSDHITQPVNMVHDPCDHVWRANATTQGAEFLGLWERIHNPESNYLEFEVIGLEAGRKAVFVRHPAHVFRYALRYV